MKPIYFILLVSVFIKQVPCKSHCVGTCYSGRLFPEAQDIFHGKHLKGYSYNNITTDDPAKCYHHCVQDCRCKSCQMKNRRCELLDEDRTSITLTDEPGYVYFDLKQTMYQGASNMIPSGVHQCYNGCCRSQPCMNGGTCKELCRTPKEKFTCECGNRFRGNVCETQIYSSCKDVVTRLSPKKSLKGVYFIRRTDSKNIIRIYCHFAKNKNRYWTLIESFSLKNNYLFKAKPFYANYSINQDRPLNWDAYRLSLDDMKSFRSSSTLFRATCDFPLRNAFESDFVIGHLKEVDIMDDTKVLGCKRYGHINIRGYNCSACTAFTAHSNDWHFHIDVTHNRCDFKPKYTKYSVDSFGQYEHTEQESKCTATLQSTTQWWLGEEK
ncbi:uncharacterized protein LOC110231781 [Exaiptasia diaphana]|uniref:Apple domain-containing protein n=1 Tax=Exaiptasia diaphana TaxID=2652724 RepID=A0A913WQB7_EXADI|nr:uncharacterized protein LOC110231781 [Exaiptasia diaphana]